MWKLLAPCALPALRQGGVACCLSCSPVVAQCALPTLRQGGAVYSLCASCHIGGTMFPTHPEGRWCSILLFLLSRARATPVTSPPGANQTTKQIYRLLSQAPFCCHRFGISTVCFLSLCCLCTTQTQSSVVFSLSVMPLYTLLGSMGSSVPGTERAVTGHQSVNQTGFFVCC